MPGIAPTSSVAVDNLGELASLFVAELVDGARCYVINIRQIYVLEKGSGALADGNNVVAPAPGAPVAGEPQARWIRQAGVFGPGVPVVSVVWKPGTVNIDEASTWADVMQFVNATEAPILVICNSSLAPLVIPAGVYDLGGKVTFTLPDNTSTLGGTDLVFVTLQDGAVLKNPAAVTGTMSIIGQSSSACIVFDLTFSGTASDIFKLTLGAHLINNGTAPMIEVFTNGFLVLFFDQFSGYGQSAPGQVLANVDNGGALVMVGLDGPVLPDGWATGAGGAQLFYVLDDTLNKIPTLAGFAGGTSFQFIAGMQCTTLTRPTSGMQPGFMIFDTSLGAAGKPIWWTGGGWVDATGAPA